MEQKLLYAINADAGFDLSWWRLIFPFLQEINLRITESNSTTSVTRLDALGREKCIPCIIEHV